MTLPLPSKAECKACGHWMSSSSLSIGLTGLDLEVAIYPTVDRSADEDTASSIPSPDAVFPA